MWSQYIRSLCSPQRFKTKSFLSFNRIHSSTPFLTVYPGLCSERTLFSLHFQSIESQQNSPSNTSFTSIQRNTNIRIPKLQVSNCFSSTSFISKAFRSKHNVVTKTHISNHPSYLLSSPLLSPSSSSSHPSASEPLPLRSLSLEVFSLSSVPKPPLYLGFAGLAPFLATSLCTYIASPMDLITFQLLQATYGACILSFLGAVHWGVAMKQDEMAKTMASSSTKSYCLSVVPSILTFVTLSCPPSIALATQLVGFHMVLFGDWISWRHRMVPDWFLPLRIWLTSIVTLCLLASLWATPYHALNNDSQGMKLQEK